MDFLYFTIFAILLLIIDLKVFHKDAHIIEFKEAVIASIFWIGIALLFNVFIYFYMGSHAAIDYLSAYIVEKSLSVDNLFVMLIIFSELKIPEAYRHNILFYGILSAIIFRGIFILIGIELIKAFDWILYVFGALLILSALKLLIQKDNDSIHVKDHPVIKFLSKFFPIDTSEDGHLHFFTKNSLGTWAMTSGFIALALIEVSDIVFAVDSIPAVFGITNDGFIAFTSNIMAILGLRSLFFVIASGIKKVKYLHYGLAIILGFVGFKLLAHSFIHIPNTISIGIIAIVLLITILISLKKKSQSSR